LEEVHNNEGPLYGNAETHAEELVVIVTERAILGIQEWQVTE
jgi:hypothetical protein